MFSFECLSSAKPTTSACTHFSSKLLLEAKPSGLVHLHMRPPLLEVKPNKSVHFHLHSNLYSEVKPDELAHFCIDSFRKPSRTNRPASTQLPCENQSGQAFTFLQNRFRESGRQSLYTLEPNS